MCSNETTKSPTFAAANTLSHSVSLSPTAALTARATGEVRRDQCPITTACRVRDISHDAGDVASSGATLRAVKRQVDGCWRVRLVEVASTFAEAPEQVCSSVLRST
jgi:hypothetical protein